MANEAAKRALMAAKARHELKTTGQITAAATRKPGDGWSAEERAYVVECIAETIRRHSPTGELQPFDAWFLGRAAHRAISGRFVYLPKLLRLLILPCAVCGRDASFRTGLRGYCHRHKSEAMDDRTRTVATVDRARSEKTKAFEQREKHEIARRHVRRYRSVMPRK